MADNKFNIWNENIKSLDTASGNLGIPDINVDLKPTGELKIEEEHNPVVDFTKEMIYSAIFMDAKDTNLSPTVEYVARLSGSILRDIGLTIATYGVANVVTKPLMAFNWFRKSYVLSSTIRGTAAGLMKTGFEDIFVDRDKFDYLINLAQFGGGDLSRSLVEKGLARYALKGGLKELFAYAADVVGGSAAALVIHGDIDQAGMEIIGPQAVAMGVVDLLFYGVKKGGLDLNKLEEDIIVQTKVDLDNKRITPDEAMSRLSTVFENKELNIKNLKTSFELDIENTLKRTTGQGEETKTIFKDIEAKDETEVNKVIEDLNKENIIKPEGKPPTTPINVERIDTDPETVKFILDTAEKVKEVKEKGKTTFKEINEKVKSDAKDLAEFLGVGEKYVKDLAILMNDMPEQIQTAREYVTTTANYIRKLAREIRAKEKQGLDVTGDKLTLAKTLTIHEGMIKDLLTVAQKSGQNLVVWKNITEGKLKSVDELYKSGQTTPDMDANIKALDGIDNIIDEIIDSGDVPAINKLVQKEKWTEKTLKALIEYRTTNLLQNFWTHSRNFTAQTGRFLFDTFKDYTAASYNLIFRKGKADGFTFAQANAKFLATVQGLSKGWKRTITDMDTIYKIRHPDKIKTKEVIDTNGVKHLIKEPNTLDIFGLILHNPKEFEKIYQSAQIGTSRINAENLNAAITASKLFGSKAQSNSMMSFLSWAVDEFGAFQRMGSYGMLQLGDAPFSYGGYLGELHSRITKDLLLKKIKTPEEAKNLYTYVLNYQKAQQLTPHIRKAAIDLGYTKESEINAYINKTLKDMEIEYPTDPKILKKIEGYHNAAVTYADDVTWKTDIDTVLGQEIHNLVQRVPIARLFFPFTKTPTKIIEYWARYSGLTKKGWQEALKGTPEAKLQQWAGYTVSGLTYTFAALLFSNGYLTPSPKNEGERRAMQEAGVQPNAIKVNNKWVNLNTIDPWPALYFSTAANVYRALLEANTVEDQEKLMEVVSGFLWATKEAVLSKTWFIPLRDMMDALQGVGTESFLSRLGRSFKPLSGYENFYNQTFAKTLQEINLKLEGRQPKLDSYGKPIEPYKMIIGLRSDEVEDSPIRREVLALGMYLPHINRTYKGVEFSDKQYYEVYQILGEMDIEGTLNNLIRSPGYKTLKDKWKRDKDVRALAAMKDKIREIYSRYVEIAKATVFRKYNELQEKYKENILNPEPPAPQPWTKFLNEIESK